MDRLTFEGKFCDIAKMIVDSLKGYLLQDDTRRYFRGLYQGFHNTQGIIVEVEEL